MTNDSTIEFTNAAADSETRIYSEYLGNGFRAVSTHLHQAGNGVLSIVDGAGNTLYSHTFYWVLGSVGLASLILILKWWSFAILKDMLKDLSKITQENFHEFCTCLRNKFKQVFSNTPEWLNKYPVLTKKIGDLSWVNAASLKNINSVSTPLDIVGKHVILNTQLYLEQLKTVYLHGLKNKTYAHFHEKFSADLKLIEEYQGDLLLGNI